MEFVTHRREDGSFQPLREHMENVARLAAEYGAAFGAEEQAGRAGLLHDIGKYSPRGQARQRDPEHTPKTDHATAGAQEAYLKLRDLPAGLAVAGHHGGLPDLGQRGDRENKPSVVYPQYRFYIGKQLMSNLHKIWREYLGL